jgi:K+-transporting ATPase ATPase B chain
MQEPVHRRPVVPAIKVSFVSQSQGVRNPVMFVTAVVTALMTVLLVVGQDSRKPRFAPAVIWLADGAVRHFRRAGRGARRERRLRATKADLIAKRLKGDGREHESVPRQREGDIVPGQRPTIPNPLGRRGRRGASVNEATILGGAPGAGRRSRDDRGRA